jgi:4'-phosphopantetheinyl transferase
LTPSPHRPFRSFPLETLASVAIESGAVVHWAVPLDLPAERVAALGTVLSEDELTRASRFHFERDRRRFVVARAALRFLLSAHCGRSAEVLRFSYGERGKPALELGKGDPPVHFNLSHSHELALIAVTRDAPIGVDVELVRPVADRDGIAARFFSPREARAVARARPEHRDEAFFRCWTRKEAFIKAVGEGMAIPLDSFAVTVGRGAPRFLAIDRDDADAWSLLHWEPASGYTGATALRSPVARVSAWTIDPSLLASRISGLVNIAESPAL